MLSWKIKFVAGLLVCSAAISILLQRQTEAAVHDRVVLLQQQERQLVELTTELQRHSNTLSRLTHPAIGNLDAEIAKLRDQAEALRQKNNALGRQLRQYSDQPGVPDSSAPENYSSEYRFALQLAAGERNTDTHKLASAILVYAIQHHGQVPSNFDELAPTLNSVTKDRGPISSTNQFDIIYHGSLSDLNGVSTGNIAVLRHRETWVTPDGKTARVYGMLDGHTQIVASDDNFQSWEADHVIDLPAAP